MADSQNSLGKSGNSLVEPKREKNGPVFTKHIQATINMTEAELLSVAYGTANESVGSS